MHPRYQAYLESRTKQDLLRTLEQRQPYRVDFSTNDMLGLSRNSKLIESAHRYAKTFGCSSSASRALSNLQAPFQEVEKALAEWLGFEQALLFASGYQANVSVLSALLNRQILKEAPLILSDRLIHASMHQGIQSSGAKQIRFPHQQMDGIEKHLDEGRVTWVLVESLYSMEGSITDLSTLKSLTENKAMLYVDEAHALGLYGPKGAGFSHGGLSTLTCATFGKALGCFGGFVACSSRLKDFLINAAPGLIYSTALPPSLLGMQLAAIECVQSMDAQRAHVKALSNHLKALLCEHGFRLSRSSSHIIGLMIPDIAMARDVKLHLAHQGIGVSLIRYPTVPKNTTRLRISIHANLKQNDLETLVHALLQARKQLGFF